MYVDCMLVLSSLNVWLSWSVSLSCSGVIGGSLMWKWGKKRCIFALAVVMHRQLMVVRRITNRWNECASRFKTKRWFKRRMVCVVSMYLAVSCVGRSCPNSLLDVCRCVVIRCIRLSCLAYALWFSSTPCSRPVWGIHQTVVSDLFGAWCASLDSRVWSVRCWMCFSVWCCGDKHSCWCVGGIPVVVVTMRRNNVR